MEIISFISILASSTLRASSSLKNLLPPTKHSINSIIYQKLDEVEDNYDTTVKTYENISYGGKVTPPSAPTKLGYVFKGWSSDSSYITGDTTILAVWQTGPIWIYLDSWEKLEYDREDVSKGS